MSSTYSTSLKLELIGNGDQSGVWGNTTNNNLGTLLEQAITGVQTITMTNADYTLSNLNGVADQARNAVLVIQGTNSAVYQIICPLVNKVYNVSNQTVGGYDITIGASTGAVVTIPNGVTAQVYCDSTNFYSAQTGSAGDFYVNGTLTAAGLTDTGNTDINGTLAVSGTTALNSTLAVTGATTLSSALTYGGVTLSNAVTGTGNMVLSASPTLTGVPIAPTAAAGTDTTQIATTAFVQANSNPAGVILMWPTSSAPSGYLLCNGATVSRTTYADLYAVVGTTFGAGDGSTTFTLPNYTNKVPYGTTVGSTGGTADAIIVSHTHTASVTDPGHTHTATVTDPGHVHGLPFSGQAYGSPNISGVMTQISSSNTNSAVTGISVSNTAASTGISVSNSTTGADGTNANLPPYLGINFIIKT